MSETPLVRSPSAAKINVIGEGFLQHLEGVVYVFQEPAWPRELPGKDEIITTGQA